ncbi:MAG: MSHA biogenesis protein MshK [Burkholderiales bacterium]|nr:MSHA biogenesis protein MshK [Burkholderiales bacterium]
MADRLMTARALAAVAALLLAAGSSAQALSDPTRPPLELMSATASAAAPHTPLQSILLSSTRKGAIIDGQYVALGGRYGNRKLVGISATAVTLKGEHGVEVLQLYPPMENASAAAGVEGNPEKVVKRP